MPCVAAFSVARPDLRFYGEPEDKVTPSRRVTTKTVHEPRHAFRLGHITNGVA
jgi:hypothetical protein